MKIIGELLDVGGQQMAREKSRWRSFRAARTFVKNLGLKNDAEWRLYCKGELKALGKKPADIPTTPSVIYEKSGWVNLGHWLGTGKVSNKKIRESYLPFAKARKIARGLGVQNRKEWQELYLKGKVPKGVPLKPERVYLDKGWVNCGDWFGTGYISPMERVYSPFSKARAFASKLQLASRQEWENYCKDGVKGKPKLPSDIPATPARIYKDKGWKGWPYWLGKKSPYKVYS